MAETVTIPEKKSFNQLLAEDIKPFEQELAAKGVTDDGTKITEGQKTLIEKEKAAPVKVTPPATTPDPDDEIITGKRSPKSEDFKRVKTTAAAARKEADELKSKFGEAEKELTELRKRPVHNADLIKKIEDEREHFKTLYETVALEFVPEFQQKYKDRLDRATSGLKSVLPADVAAKVGHLLQMPESESKQKALSEIAAELNEIQVGEIVAANREVRLTLADREAELGKSREALDKIATDRQNKAREHGERLGQLFDSVVGQAQAKDSKTAIPVFELRDGDGEDVKQWNDGVSERVKVAKAIFSGQQEPEDRAQAALWAASAPEFLAELKAAQSALAERDQLIAKLQGASPGINGSGKGDGDKGPVLGSFARGVASDLAGA